MNGITSTTKQARRSGATVRRWGAGSVLAVALIAAGASPALAGTGHPAGTHSTRAQHATGSHLRGHSRVTVHLGPAVSIVRSAGSSTLVR